MLRDWRDGLLAYRFKTLPDGVDAFVSTRHGGVSPRPYDSLNLGLRVGDDGANVVENRRRLCGAFGIELERSVWCRQIHADGVAVVGDADAGRGSTGEGSIVEDADALVTRTPGLSLCVTLADCVPVVIFDPERVVLGVAHAGWGGTVSRIASRTVAVMRDRFGSEPRSVVAAIGPSIGPAAYEVGPDVVERCERTFAERAPELLSSLGEGRARFDLWSANRIDLEGAGVSAARIEVASVSTEEHLDDLYSYRAEGVTGRFACVATLAARE
jgi:YfiH family protein